jgi:hypothetical protein
VAQSALPHTCMRIAQPLQVATLAIKQSATDCSPYQRHVVWGCGSMKCIQRYVDDGVNDSSTGWLFSPEGLSLRRRRSWRDVGRADACDGHVWDKPAVARILNRWVGQLRLDPSDARRPSESYDSRSISRANLAHGHCGSAAVAQWDTRASGCAWVHAAFVSQVNGWMHMHVTWLGANLCVCAAHTELPNSRHGELLVSKSNATIMIIVCSAWREVRSLSYPLG